MGNFKFVFGVLCLSWLAACSQADLPIPTALPPVTPIAGWSKLNNEGVEVWLPDNFVGGSNLDISTLAKRLADLGPDFAQAAQAIQQYDQTVLLFAVDTTKSRSGAATNLLVAKEVVRGGLEMSSYLDSLASHLPTQVHVVLKEVVTFERYPTGRLVADVGAPQGNFKQVMYAIKNGNAVWQFVFSTPADEFDERWPVFETIAKTISVPYSIDETSQGNVGNQGIVFIVGFVIAVGGGLLSAWLKRRRKPKVSS